jgi:hypothetical protein
MLRMPRLARAPHRPADAPLESPRRVLGKRFGSRRNVGPRRPRTPAALRGPTAVRLEPPELYRRQNTQIALLAPPRSLAGRAQRAAPHAPAAPRATRRAHPTPAPARPPLPRRIRPSLALARKGNCPGRERFRPNTFITPRLADLLTPRAERLPLGLCWHGSTKSFPCTTLQCGAERRMIAFVIEAPSVSRILESVGEPIDPPPPHARAPHQPRAIRHRFSTPRNPSQRPISKSIRACVGNSPLPGLDPTSWPTRPLSLRSAQTVIGFSQQTASPGLSDIVSPPRRPSNPPHPRQATCLTQHYGPERQLNRLWPGEAVESTMRSTGPQ